MLPEPAAIVAILIAIGLMALLCLLGPEVFAPEPAGRAMGIR